MTRFVLALALLVLAVLVPGVAEAHKAGLSRGDYRVSGDVVDAEIVFERGELAALAPSADRDRNGTLDASELHGGTSALASAVVDRIAVKGDGRRCPGTLEGAREVEADGALLHARYRCESPPKHVAIDVGFFDELAFGHRHLASLAAGGPPVEDVLYASHHAIAADVQGSGAAAPTSVPESKPSSTAASLFLLGVEHILTGYDHLLFLFGLVLVGGRVRSLVAVVTAFTIGHSISLALAVLGVWAPSPRLVEPAIALSIAYVGIENFFVHDAHKRWRITLPFGLVHGFGFAGALQELELPRAKIPLALLLFNGGVEAGQLAVLAVMVPVLIFLRRKPWFVGQGIRVVSAGIVAAGLVWFVQRLTGLGTRGNAEALGCARRSIFPAVQDFSHLPLLAPGSRTQEPRHSASPSQASPSCFGAAHVPEMHWRPGSQRPPTHSPPARPWAPGAHRPSWQCAVGPQISLALHASPSFASGSHRRDTHVPAHSRCFAS